jgi:hypothetical protein
MGTASGAAAAGSGGFGSTGISFLGVQTQAKRMVVAIDVSGSVATKARDAGIPMDKIKEKFIETVEKFSINSKFGIILFSRAYVTFSGELQPSSPAKKKDLVAWAEEMFPKGPELLPPGQGKAWSRRNQIREKPDSIESVLSLAFSMKPDVIILISDGDFQRSVEGKKHGEQVEWTEIKKLVRLKQEELDTPAKIFFVGFGMEQEHLREARSLTSSTGGKLNEIK